DFMVNGWLIEMGIGAAPADLLHDPAFKGLSAETIYDILCTDLRRGRKLMTLRGAAGGDMIDGPSHGRLTDRDDFIRRALMQGLEYHIAAGRGLLPAGLVEEIRSLAQPPVPWEVDLAHWFDEYFLPLESERTYRRLSRRQEATPDIPRPSHMPDLEAMEGRTFGAVIDTSGSMPRALLGRALGTVASYAHAKDVNLVRTVFCDAAAYDQGYVDVATLAYRVKVRGRGGTVLQPGIDLLEKAKDFPRDAPIMIITDAGCDVLSIKRDHAIICPAWAKLPFIPRGPVFRMPGKKVD
ncbi:MAG TPA: hypothetical protein VKT70_01660, partial [Stellaceae bacterium]|nr:hypothetical protein [Stellaceae bacterium]